MCNKREREYVGFYRWHRPFLRCIHVTCTDEIRIAKEPDAYDVTDPVNRAYDQNYTHKQILILLCFA